MPLHIRNAPTKLMKELDYGKDYKYAHDYAECLCSAGIPAGKTVWADIL